MESKRKGLTTVVEWWRHGHFDSVIEATGAFKLAYQQGLDGCGRSVQEWMGLNEDEFTAWMLDGALPPRRR